MNKNKINKNHLSLLDSDNLPSQRVHPLLDILNDIFPDVKILERCMHMIPGDIKMHHLDFHVLVEVDHVGALVVVFTAEEMCQKEHHSGVQFGNVADVL